MSATRVPAALRQRVARQARYRCGYCLTAEEVVGAAMQVDHMLPEALGGLTEEENLWLACSDCNTFKSDHTSPVDPLTKDTVALFNPRQHRWREHFAWTAEGDYIVGQTPIGRATVAALKLSRLLLVRARRLWVRIGVHPPAEVVDV